jgi:hypothetical protein
MRTLLALPLLACLTALGCKKDDPTPPAPAPSASVAVDSGVKVGDDEEDYSAQLAALLPEPVPPDFLLLKEGPSALVHLQGDIRIEASGKTTVVNKGTKKTATMSAEAMGFLIAQIRRSNFFELPDEVGCCKPTTRVTTTTITMEGKTKKVRNYFSDVRDAGAVPRGSDRSRVFDVESGINSGMIVTFPEALLPHTVSSK